MGWLRDLQLRRRNERLARAAVLYDRQRGHGRMVPANTRPPDRNNYEWFEMFARSPRLAVVDRIAGDMSFVSGKLCTVDSEGEEQEIKEHPFLDFWAKPNPFHELNASAIWQLFEIYLTIKGEGFMVKERDNLGRVCELWPVPPLWVYQTPYIGYPFYKIRTPSNQVMEVPVDDMFIMRSLNPLNPFLRGLGQAEAIAQEIEIDEYAALFQKNFFENDATPPVIVSLEGSDDAQRKRFGVEWRSRHRGVRNSHEVAFVSGNVNAVKLADSMKDMDMVEGRKFIRDSVLEHFQVPREIMGITENSNRSTAEAAQYIYAQNVLMPRLRRREEAVNTQLLCDFGDNLVWHYDDIVPRNAEFDKAKALDGWNAGLYMKDEARDLLDAPPCPNDKRGNPTGQVYKGQVADVYIRADEDPAEIAGAPTGGGGFSYMSRASPAAQRKAARPQPNRDALLRSYDAVQKQQTRMFEVALTRYFAEQGKQIFAALGDIEKAESEAWNKFLSSLGNPTDEAIKAAWEALPVEQRDVILDEFVDGLLDWDRAAKTYEDILVPMRREAFKAGAENAQKTYALRGVQRPELTDSARSFGGDKIANDIQQTTKDRIKNIVTQGLESGKSTRQITGEIVEAGVKDTRRARTIANQEAIMSLNSGQVDMMKSGGFGFKVWHHRRQVDPRDGEVIGGKKTPDHQSKYPAGMDGERVPIDDAFSNGLRFPRDPAAGKPEESINCHCYLTYE